MGDQNDSLKSANYHSQKLKMHNYKIYSVI